MSVKIREKRGRLYLDIIQNRKHKWESLKIILSENPRERKEQMQFAEICRAKRELQLARGEWNETDTIAGKTPLVAYWHEMAKGRTVKDPLHRGLKHLENYKDGGNIQLVAVNAKWVQDFQDYLLNDTGLSQTTASNYSLALRQVFNKAVRERILTHNPCETIKSIQRTESNKDVLNADEIRLLANTPCNGKLGEEVKRAFLFACMTGLRLGDIAGKERTRGQGALLWQYVETKDISQYNKCKYWIKTQQNKVSRFVEIPLNNTAWQLIQPRKFPSEFIFQELAESGTHTDKYIKKWAELAGIKKTIGMHTARRTFATLLQERGTDLYTIKRLTGHKIEDVTGLYAKSTSLLPEAVLKLDDILNGANYLQNVAGGTM